jgi:hypothetical protein
MGSTTFYAQRLPRHYVDEAHARDEAGVSIHVNAQALNSTDGMRVIARFSYEYECRPFATKFESLVSAHTAGQRPMDELAQCNAIMSDA